MPTALENLTTVYNQNRSITIGVGASIEYNMNSMINNITAITTSTDANYISEITGTSVTTINPFKKLFPVDSVIKPFRPLSAGVKYYIVSSIDTPQNSFSSFRTVEYPGDKPRIYYPGSSNSYKYWLSPKNGNADITIKYVQSTATVTEAYSAGNSIDGNQKVHYTTSAPHGLTLNDKVSITGLSTSAFNLTTKSISSIPTATTFTIDSTVTGTAVTGASATATVVNSSGTSTPTKSAYTNKIVVQFEKNHALPTQYRLIITPVSGSVITTTYTAPPANGRIERYWNGTNWNTTSLTEPYVYTEPYAIKSIQLQATNPGGEKYIGVIEISARWIKDISSDLISVTLAKESSDSSQDILPIGKVTANSLQISAARYNQSELKIVPYNRDEAWPTSTTELIYMMKNAEIKPYFKIYHSAGTLGSSPDQYDKVYQGTYYIDTWTIDSYGNLNVTSLDGVKPLMETIAPDIVCDYYPVTAVFTRLLDSVGFTNYNFNLKKDGSDLIDTSIPVISYWWTDGNKTVWEYIQELCRDIQMNAVMDDNNILQFYSRDYLYSQETSLWNFREEADGTNLSNIVSFSQKEIPSANQVRVLWKAPTNSSYTGQSEPLWQSPETYLAAGGIKNNILATTPAEDTQLVLDLFTIDSYNKIQSSSNFAGYFLINSEVIEYDAIEYTYLPIDTVTYAAESFVTVWVESESDVNKYRYLSKPGYADVNKPETSFFKPTGRYRVKKRGALNTTPAKHDKTESKIDSTKWSTAKVVWE